jgi:hypothetical protein
MNSEKEINQRLTNLAHLMQEVVEMESYSASKAELLQIYDAILVEAVTLDIAAKNSDKDTKNKVKAVTDSTFKMTIEKRHLISTKN